MKGVICKLFSIILIIFGLVGIIGSFYLMFTIHNYNISSSMFQIDLPVQKQFSLMSDTMLDAAITARHASFSINNAISSLRSGARFLFMVQDTFYTISRKVEILKSVSIFFYDASQQIEEVGENLIDTSDSLYENSIDMMKLGDDFQDMSKNLNEIAFVFNDTTQNIESYDFNKEKNYVKMACVYVGILHLMFVFIGIILLKIT